MRLLILLVAATAFLAGCAIEPARVRIKPPIVVEVEGVESEPVKKVKYKEKHKHKHKKGDKHEYEYEYEYEYEDEVED